MSVAKSGGIARQFRPSPSPGQLFHTRGLKGRGVSGTGRVAASTGCGPGSLSPEACRAAIRTRVATAPGRGKLRSRSSSPPREWWQRLTRHPLQTSRAVLVMPAVDGWAGSGPRPPLYEALQMGLSVRMPGLGISKPGTCRSLLRCVVSRLDRRTLYYHC